MSNHVNIIMQALCEGKSFHSQMRNNPHVIAAKVDALKSILHEHDQLDMISDVDNVMSEAKRKLSDDKEINVDFSHLRNATIEQYTRIHGALDDYLISPFGYKGFKEDSLLESMLGALETFNGNAQEFLQDFQTDFVNIFVPHQTVMEDQVAIAIIFHLTSFPALREYVRQPSNYGKLMQAVTTKYLYRLVDTELNESDILNNKSLYIASIENAILRALYDDNDIEFERWYYALFTNVYYSKNIILKARNISVFKTRPSIFRMIQDEHDYDVSYFYTSPFDPYKSEIISELSAMQTQSTEWNKVVVSEFRVGTSEFRLALITNNLTMLQVAEEYNFLSRNLRTSLYNHDANLIMKNNSRIVFEYLLDLVINKKISEPGLVLSSAAIRNKKESYVKYVVELAQTVEGIKLRLLYIPGVLKYYEYKDSITKSMFKLFTVEDSVYNDINTKSDFVSVVHGKSPLLTKLAQSIIDEVGFGSDTSFYHAPSHLLTQEILRTTSEDLIKLYVLSEPVDPLITLVKQRNLMKNITDEGIVRIIRSLV